MSRLIWLLCNAVMALSLLTTLSVGAIPRNYIPAVEKGIRERMDRGLLAGFPVVDIQIDLFDGKYHPVDSSDMAFQIAGSIAFAAAAEEADRVFARTHHERRDHGARTVYGQYYR